MLYCFFCSADIMWFEYIFVAKFKGVSLVTSCLKNEFEFQYIDASNSQLKKIVSKILNKSNLMSSYCKEERKTRDTH